MTQHSLQRTIAKKAMAKAVDQMKKQFAPPPPRAPVPPEQPRTPRAMPGSSILSQAPPPPPKPVDLVTAAPAAPRQVAVDALSVLPDVQRGLAADKPPPPQGLVLPPGMPLRSKAADSVKWFTTPQPAMQAAAPAPFGTPNLLS
jgi:hypothetical protein